ncbi:MAG: hypothetical protein RMJ28_02160 [Nitrososphaerota archaeon]|nr:hypothetical protein [Candidatus Calditenuaceae archaeon]MDW8073026.1 hypothetical protein [Nitrososphaerota archaeon]
MRTKIPGLETLPPIFLTIALWLFILNLSESYVEIQPVAPVVVVEEPVESPATSPAPYLNTLTFISIIAVAGFTVFLVFRKYPNIISLFAIGAFWLVTFLTLLIHIGYVGQLVSTVPVNLIILIVLAASVLITFLVRKTSGVFALIAACVTAAAGGTIIGYMIPLFTFIALISSLTVFDLVMVKKGYLSLLSRDQYRERIHQLKGLVVEVGDINLGLGDLLFYTITVTTTFFRLGLYPAIAANLAIMAGYFLTLQLLRRWSTVPGLTIPLALALAASLIVDALLS